MLYHSINNGGCGFLLSAFSFDLLYLANKNMFKLNTNILLFNAFDPVLHLCITRYTTRQRHVNPQLGNQLRLLNIISLLSVNLSQSKKKW
jgi:hypothetical protein